MLINLLLLKHISEINQPLRRKVLFWPTVLNISVGPVPSFGPVVRENTVAGVTGRGKCLLSGTQEAKKGKGGI
jgi:hypothetical protein